MRAQVEGRELTAKTVPRGSMFNGLGSPWLIFLLPLQQEHSEQTIRFELVGLLP